MLDEQLALIAPESPEAIVERAEQLHGPFLRRYCLFSGGDDSAAVAHRMSDAYDELVFIDTGTSIGPSFEGDTTPSVEAHVVGFAEHLGKPLRVYRAGDEYERMVTGGPAYAEFVDVMIERARRRGRALKPADVYRIAQARMESDPLLGRSSSNAAKAARVGLPCDLPLGFPGPLMHGRCYNRLKERGIDALVRETIAEHGPGRVLLITGVRRDESQRRSAREPITTKGPRVFANPLIDWQTPTVKRYRREHGLPESDVALLLHRSGECGCAAYANVGEREEVRSIFPTWFEHRIAPMEAECRRLGIPSDTWGAGPHSPQERELVRCGARARPLYAPDTPEPAGLLCSTCSLFPVPS